MFRIYCQKQQMGLLTDSKSLRTKMLSRNIYSAEHMYGLGNNILSKTLDTFATLGMDLRTSTLLAGTERLLDNTPLSTIGLKRLAVEIARRTANNVFRQEIGVVNVDNIFSKDPNKKFITHPVDFNITPSLKPTGIIDYLIKAAGYESEEQHAVAGKENSREESPGGSEYYNNLGIAQKAKLHEQLSMNNYNRFPNGNDPYAGLRAIPGRYTSVQSTYSNEYLNARSGDTYASYIQDENSNSSLNAQTRTISNIEDATNAGVNNMRQIETEGFGQTSLPDNTTGNGVDDTDRFFQYGIEADLNKFGIKRGLMYYTQQMMRGNGAIPRALDRESTGYGVGERNAIVYRGSSPCRNFTMNNQLDTLGQAMRFTGNGNPESVVGESVMPRMYPSKPSDKSNLMFSIENLAYSREDLLDMPESEQGPNEGRIMWFPPYALQHSITYNAGWETTSLLGRTEPMYTYNGVTRSLTISFMLLIDTPPNVLDMKKSDMAQWFLGCLDERPAPIENIKPSASKLVVPTRVDILDVKQKPTTYAGFKPLYSFQNNVFAIETDYEISETKNTTVEDPRNLYGLNTKSFFPRVEPMLRYIHEQRQLNQKVFITIEGRCSALFTDLYNAKLSYRRAASLKDYLIERYSELYGEKITLMNDMSPADFTAIIGVANINQTWIIPSKDGSLEISIIGRGETLADSRSDEKKEINDKYTKTRRVAGVNTLRSEPRKITYPKTEPPKTVAEAKGRRDDAQARDEKKEYSGPVEKPYNLFRNDHNAESKIAGGWDNVDYYAPMFHSQTPYNMHTRRQFLAQLMYPGDTVEKADKIGSNNLFGRMPVCIIRIADEIHSKAVINNLTLDMTDSTWDVNPEGMGMQAMYLKVTIDANLIGGMSLKNPINRLQTATDFNHMANGSFYSDPYYSERRWDYIRADHGDDFRKADSRVEPKDKTKN